MCSANGGRGADWPAGGHSPRLNNPIWAPMPNCLIIASYAGRLRQVEHSKEAAAWSQEAEQL